jgi:hypothetical protein
LAGVAIFNSESFVQAHRSKVAPCYQANNVEDFRRWTSMDSCLTGCIGKARSCGARCAPRVFTRITPLPPRFRVKTKASITHENGEPTNAEAFAEAMQSLAEGTCEDRLYKLIVNSSRPSALLAIIERSLSIPNISW